MKKKTLKNNLLAVRIEPWQLFRFKKLVEYRNSKPNIIIQEALQIYFSQLDLPRDLIEKWLQEYHEEREKRT